MQTELLAFKGDTRAYPTQVAFIGDNISAIADLLSQGANVNKYYLMVLIDHKYWAFYPAYEEAQKMVSEPYSGSSILSFEDMETIENQLLARAS